MTEHHEQVAIFQWSAIAMRQDARLALLFAIPNAGGYVGGYRSNVARVMSMKAEGVKPGVPDMFLAVPVGGYHGLFIELKNNGKKKAKVSNEQRDWINALIDIGYRAEICYGAESAVQIIIEYLKGEHGKS